LPTKRFLLIYADRSRAHISTDERDSLLIAKRIKKLNDFTYEYIAPPLISRTFSQLQDIAAHFQPITPVKRHIEGNFIIERAGKRTRELLETPEGLQIRLATA
jgi:hypothetical protein